MARVTVEDCLEKVPNRFDLVLMAARQARQLDKGAPPLIDNGRNSKPCVLALREIAAGAIDASVMDEAEEEADAEAQAVVDVLAGKPA